MKVVSVQKMLDVLVVSWEKAGPGEAHNSHGGVLEWETFSHKFNKVLREGVKILLAGDSLNKPVKELEFGVASLQAIYSVWKAQYRLYDLKISKIVGRGKLKKLQKEYVKALKEARVQIFKYEKIVQTKDKGVNGDGSNF